MIEISNVQIVLRFIPKDQWEFIDFYSFNAKMDLLNSFFNNKIKEFKEAFSSKENKPINYLDKIKIKIIDNLHINFKNIHIRIEDCIRYPYSSFGLTLEEFLIINTNDNWEETFITRSQDTQQDLFKLLKIKNLGLYLNPKEDEVISNDSNNNKITQENIDKVKDSNKDNYLIQPISIIGKMKQTSKVNIDKDNQIPQIEIWISFENFLIDFKKEQYDTIVRTLNFISLYRKYQYFKQESQHYKYYHPEEKIQKTSCLKWWKFAIRTIIKRRKFYLGKENEFNINQFLLNNYKEHFQNVYRLYLNNNNSLDKCNNDDTIKFKRIITIIDINLLYEWSIENIKEYFTNNKLKENSNKDTPASNILNFFSLKVKKPQEVKLQLSKEEEDKIEELINVFKKEVKKEIEYSKKSIQLKINFTLNEGVFDFSNENLKSNTSAVFGFEYKNLSITIIQAQKYTHIEATLLYFDMSMCTQKSNKRISKINITLQDKNENVNKDYIWKLNLRINGPSEKINNIIDLKINTLDIVYNQSLIERILSFFIVKTKVDDNLTAEAMERISQFKQKANETVQTVMNKKNIVNIIIEPRKIIIPLNKYDFKHSKAFVLELGQFSIANEVPSENYSERYQAIFSSMNIVYLDSSELISSDSEKFYILNNLRFTLFFGILTNQNLSQVFPKIELSLKIDNIDVNLTERIYYSLHFFKEILSPTKQDDYWAILEQNTYEIKNSCKVLSKLSKKDNLLVTAFYEECFGVLSGGYIYFFKTVDDKGYDSYFFIKGGEVKILQEDEEKKCFEMNISNKYGNIDLKFQSKKKFSQFYKHLIERLSEMNVITDKKVIKNKEQNDTKTKKNPNQKIVSLAVCITKLKCNFYSPLDAQEKIICNTESQSKEFVNIFTFTIENMSLIATLRAYDISLSFEIFRAELYDEFNKNNSKLYQMISSLNPIKQEQNLLNINIIISNSKSPLYSKTDIFVSLQVGYINVIWNPYRIRRLLFFLINNDILRNKIMDEITLVPSHVQLIELNKTFGYNNQLISYLKESNENIRANCGKNLDIQRLRVDVIFEKICMIWIQPKTLDYIAEINLNQSKLNVNMSVDHFKICGTLGSFCLYDITDYPYHNPLLDNNNYKTIILSSNNNFFLSFDFFSKSLSCPLVENNYTIECSLVFHSIKLNYIHEIFFRGFNYIFDEFLNAFQVPPEVKKYKNMKNKFPVLKIIETFEFIRVKVEFINPQIVLKARSSFDDLFLGDLGIITITNSYQLEKGKYINEPQREIYVNIFHLKLDNLYLNHNDIKIIDNTNGEIDIKVPQFLNDEENYLSDNIIDKSIKISVVITKDIKLYFNQNTFTEIMRLCDLNILYQDGQDDLFKYKEYYISFFNLLSIDKNSEESIGINCLKIRFIIDIPILSVYFYDSYYNKNFCRFDINQTQVEFLLKITGPNEINLKMKSSYGYSIPLTSNDTTQEIMLSPNTSNESQVQFDIRLVNDREGEKNLIIKIANLKYILQLEILKLLKLFFLEGMPSYSPNSRDLPNKYNPDVENKPSLRIHIDVNNILICLRTDSVSSNKKEILCLSTNFHLLYKKPKIALCKKELISDFDIYTDKINNTLNKEERIGLQKRLSQNNKELESINVSFYDITPFICCVDDVFSINMNIPKRKLMNTFNIEYSFVTVMTFSSQKNFIKKSQSNININNIVCKLSYSDLVLFLRAIEFNCNKVDDEYENAIASFYKIKSQYKEDKYLNDVPPASVILDKGTGFDEIFCESLKLILIDNHADTYYPFLSFICKEITLTRENLSKEQNVITGGFLFKVIVYNYYVGIWEPVIEKTLLNFEKTTDRSSKYKTYQNYKFEIIKREGKIPANINISDISITFLYSVLYSWIDKFIKLKRNYKVESQNFYKDQQKGISNHRVFNYSGRKMTIYWIQLNKEMKEISSYECTMISSIEPNEYYDIEYSVDSINNIEPIRKRNSSIEKYISISFDKIDINKIKDNYIRIEHIQFKKHNVTYDNIAKDIEINNELKHFEYIVSEVKVKEMKKVITIYSPLLFYNQLDKPLMIRVIKKKYQIKGIIKQKGKYAIPYELFDGNIEFKFNEDDQPQVFDLRLFLEKDYTNSEMRFDDKHIFFYGRKSPKFNQAFITVIISYPFLIRNYLPFAISFNIKQKSFTIPKSGKCYIDNISSNDQVKLDNFKCGSFSNKNNTPIIVLTKGKKDEATFSIFDSLTSKKSNNKLQSSSFYLYDLNDNNVEILYSIINNNNTIIEYNKTIVFHCSGIIYNSTLKKLRLFYYTENGKVEIPGQQNDANIFIINNQKKLVVELIEKDIYTSKPVPLNAIGILTNLELLPQRSRSYDYFQTTIVNYNFNLETNISSISEDLEIYTTIITIHPKYIVSNKTNYSIFICTNNTSEPINLMKGRSYPIFFPLLKQHNMCIRPIQDESKYKSGSKWNWSYPVNIEQTGIITAQIFGINPKGNKMYLNIEKKVEDYSTFIILTETTIYNSQITIENESSYISMRVYQIGCELGSEYVPNKKTKMFSWGNNKESIKKLKIEFIYGKNALCNITDIREFSFITANSKDSSMSQSEKIYYNNKEMDYPFVEEFEIRESKYKGYRVKLGIDYDGIKKTIKLIDNISKFYSVLNFSPGEIYSDINSYAKVNEIHVKIEQIGISLISENRSKNISKENALRNEICYATLKGIHFYYRTEQITQRKSSEIQCRIKSIQIDNMLNYMTQYPIILLPQRVDEDKLGIKEPPPFFNIAASYYTTGNQIKEQQKFNYFNYLVQSFEISIERETLESIINFTNNITNQLNTSFTKVHRLLLIDNNNNNNNISKKEFFLEPFWVNSDNISSEMSKIYFKNFEMSSVEIIASFTAGEVLEIYITTNPLLRTLFTTIINIEKADLMLNGSIMHNLYISPSNLLMLAINQYKQSLFKGIFSVIGAIDVFGNPNNLFKSLGTGVRDFFEKPIKGIIKGPLEGVEGAIKGGYSLIKHTIGGTFSATSKITSGISKGLLHISQDEKYLQKIEREKILKKPKNFVDGMGFGITSFANGVLSGVYDIVGKPIEETQKKGLRGFGTGIAKGIGGLFSKPVVGILQLLSNTSEGIKNSFTNEEGISKQRRIRPFYGRNKYIKSYKSQHAYVLWFIQRYVDEIKNNRDFAFCDADAYENKKGESSYIVYEAKGLYIIDIMRKQLKISLPYSNIKEVQLNGNKDVISLIFNSEVKGKKNAQIILLKETWNSDIIVEKIKKNIKNNLDSIN